jgi:hypothetical protein
VAQLELHQLEVVLPQIMDIQLFLAELEAQVLNPVQMDIL